MAKTKRSVKRQKQIEEPDSIYILKLVMYMIIGSLWIKITTSNENQIPIPIGFVIGLYFAMHDHFKVDRKIEYAILLVAMLFGFWLPIGLFVSL